MIKEWNINCEADILSIHVQTIGYEKHENTSEL